MGDNQRINEGKDVLLCPNPQVPNCAATSFEFEKSSIPFRCPIILPLQQIKTMQNNVPILAPIVGTPGRKMVSKVEISRGVIRRS